MKTISSNSCYVCGHGPSSYSARGLNFHTIPKPSSKLEIRDKWLEFLHLPPTSVWPKELWRNITLCSLHFEESNYSPRRQEQICTRLLAGSVPSKKTLSAPGDHESTVEITLMRDRPSSAGVLGEIFSQLPESTCLDPPPSADAENNHTLKSYDDCQNQEQLPNQFMLNDERKKLCRLCGLKGSLLIPLFTVLSGSSSLIPLLSKIEMYLPFKVKEEDPLPYHICLQCCDILNQWHDFYVNSVAADTALWKIFGGKTKIYPEDIDCTNPSFADDQQNAASITVDGESQIQKDPSLTLIQHEIKENKDVQQNTPTANIRIEDEAEIHQKPVLPCTPHEIKEKEDVCMKHGESNSVEDRSFMVEFDKNFKTFRDISYKCKYCFELFSNSTHRKNHLAKCRMLSTICELCGHVVSCRKDLRRHKYRQHDRKDVLNILNIRYLCDKCNKSFKTTGSLRTHIKNIHGTRDHSVKYCCQLCCSAFRQETNFLNHKRKHETGMIKSIMPIETICQKNSSEDSENTVYCCPVCQENFDDILSFVIHLTAKKKMKCMCCHKKISCEKRFFLHKCELWTCQYCLKTFDQKIKLIVHERYHTGEKPFKCRTCDLTFRTWHNRRRHEIRHNPFQCVLCQKTFRNKYVFQDHVSRHEGKSFLCHICDKNFSGRKNLWKHVKIIHKNTEKVPCIYL